ncbi:MAG: site-specific integrase [Treponema sp.]|nr:site-specific integrase [Treponema sp.]
MKLNREMSLKNWLNIWYETYAKPFVKHSTLVSYEGYIRKHINPHIGDIPLCDLNAIILQDFFNQQYKNGNCRKGDKSGLSPKTLLNIRIMLHEVIADAMKNNLIDYNYIECVKIPKKEKVERRVLTRKEQSQLITTLNNSNDPFAFGIFLSLMTGIRAGELYGLYWSDFKTASENLTIMQIRRTLGRYPNLDKTTPKKTIITITSPKSNSGNRDIPLQKNILSFLSKYYNMQNNIIGKKYTQGNQFVFSRISGKPIEPKFIQEKFKKFLNESNIPDTNFHTLRHTFATRALECGVDFKTLSVILGHADVITTMNLYQHVSIEQKQNAMEKMQKIII